MKCNRTITSEMSSTNNTIGIKRYACINCGCLMQELYKKYSNTLKTAHCDKCHKIADKYIEFELLIILVDAMLLSQKAFRHMIYNANYKAYWKLSLVLLLLESFALWRKKRGIEVDIVESDSIHEKGFYICSLQNLADYLIITCLLLIISSALDSKKVFRTDFKRSVLIMLKAVSISNLSKVFILPILVWRENTTDLGRVIHYILVVGHHLCSLVLVYEVVGVGGCGQKRWLAVLVVLTAYVFKEFLKREASALMEAYI